MSKKKILILNDGKKFSNWGIQAATDGIVNIIKEHIKNAEIAYLPHSVLQKNFSFDPTIFGKKLFNRNSRIAKRYLSEYIEIPLVTDEFEFIADKWINNQSTKGTKEIMYLLNKSDFVVFNAEGSTYRNNRSAIRALYILWFASRKLNKPSFFLNGSVTITSVDPIIPAMIRKTFSQIEGISVREPTSFKNIINYYPALESKVKMIPDSAFSVDTNNLKLSYKVKSLDLNKEYFCFSTSMLPIDYRKSKNKSAIFHILSEMKSKIPNLFILAKDIEDQFLRGLANDINATFIGPEYTYEDVLYILSRAKLLFSGRYHHIIFSTKVGTPVIPMNTTSHKIVGLQQLFKDLMPVPVDPTNLWTEKEKILEYMKQQTSSDEIGKKYFEIASTYKKSVFEHAEVVLNGLNIND